MSHQPDSDAGRVLIGYARVSTRGQDLDQQRATLGAVGCIRIFEEKASGAKRDRPELARMLDHLRAGDVVTITRLDALPDRRPTFWRSRSGSTRPALTCARWQSRGPTRRRRPGAWC